MSYSAIQDTPIVINLLKAANDTGWSISGDVAVHELCNAGSITNTSFPVYAGQSYEVSYAVLSISGGYVQAQVPGNNGSEQTTADLYVETLTPSANGFVSFYSNANCQIESFNIRNSTQVIGVTIAYSAKDQKWSDFRTYYPDWGWSLYDRVIIANQGAIYASENGSTDTNTFFGVTYPSTVKLVSAKQPTVIKQYQSISLQANQLMVTTTDGVKTSLGQVSDLATYDFVKTVLKGGASSVQVTSVEGVYSASFLRNKQSPGGLINGDNLRGNYLVIELTTIVGAAQLSLFTVEVNASISKIGSR